MGYFYVLTNWKELCILHKAIIENYIQTMIRFPKTLVYVFTPELNMFRFDFREHKHIHISLEKIYYTLKRAHALHSEVKFPFCVFSL